MRALRPEFPEGRYLCAFSGGADSTALLALLKAFLPADSLLAAHLDHGLRAGSKDEAEAAKEAAASLGLDCLVEAKDVAALAASRGKGIEEAGRAARYDFLKRALDGWGGDWIVTAHQAEDQAETIVLKLARGGGPGALAGIRAISGPVLRPLLSFGRQELLSYLAQKGLGYMEDESNQDPRFRRNQARRDILPRLAELNPAYLAALGRAAEIAWAEEDFWGRRLDQLEAALVKPDGDGGFLVEAAGLCAISLAERRRLAGRLFRRISVPGRSGGEPVSFRTVEDLLGVLAKPGSGGLDLPGGRRAEWRGRFLRLGPASRFLPASPMSPASPGL
jgi:tRNA(Ile)-lysidine synthase